MQADAGAAIFQDAVADGQAEASAGAGGLARDEGVEELVAHRFRHAGTGVVDDDFETLWRQVGAEADEVAAEGRDGFIDDGVTRVGEEVDEDLFEPVLIAKDEVRGVDFIAEGDAAVAQLCLGQTGMIHFPHPALFTTPPHSTHPVLRINHEHHRNPRR